VRVSADTWGPSLLDNAAGCEHRAETAFEKTMCQISSSDSGKEMQMGLADYREPLLRGEWKDVLRA
jgi:hypothetical protein